MVTYNKTLINFIKYLYEKVDSEKKEEVLTLFTNKSDKLELMNIDKIIYAYFMEYKKQNKLKVDVLLDNGKKRDILGQYVLEIQKKYSDAKVIDLRNLNFLMEEIEWLKSCNYMELEEYQSVDRLGRMSIKSGDGPQKLLKNSNSRQGIYELMHIYTNKLRDNGFVDFQDMALMALEQAKKKVGKKYTHIVIDESQDLTRVQLEFLKHLYNEKPYSSILFVADIAQSIYAKAWLVKGRRFTSLGLDMTGKSNSLAKNYRTTTQIAECAYSLIQKDENIVSDDNFVKPSLIDKQGVYPILRAFTYGQDESNYVISLLKENLLKQYDNRDIAIITRTKNQLVEMKEKLLKEDIKCRYFDKNEIMDFQEDTVKLLTMHSIKGLEFKVVILIGLNNKAIPSPYAISSVEDKSFYESMERKLLYVGMTRATEKLYMTYAGEASKFISDISPKFLKINETAKVKRYYSVATEEFLLKEKITDMYSQEEKVRQWALKELIDTYKYPLDLIQIEHEVNVFSNKGLVDIVVNVYSNKSKIPYIFIEVKRKNRGIQDCLEQLKSYMSVSKQCRYGIATDGNEFVIIDSNFEKIDDIPMFDISMLPSTIESFEYIDFKHGRKYDFLRDCNNITELVVDEN